MTHEFKTKGICPKALSFDIDDGILSNISFKGGCPGNLRAIAKLVEGQDAQKIAKHLEGINCLNKGTSCANELSKAIKKVLSRSQGSGTIPQGMDLNGLVKHPIKLPIGEMLMVGQADALMGLWYKKGAHLPGYLHELPNDPKLPVFKDLTLWLKDYFAGKNPSLKIPTRLYGSDFQKDIWELLETIPYRELLTYKELTTLYLAKTKRKTMSIRAVGGAVGRNPISILIPCHRVIAEKRKLGGYGGGLKAKSFLLELEGHKVNVDKMVLS
ncbi:MAG: TIGR03905 family TSCPD domain-containing protein [Deltaproteobacteria bacterium]|jgi:methylated-DNA-[protein]-cysteine S-methyltransferase|nr:TIGR03905 family TSCPD domain-containing protein [Deltaproteobacteria bacterium]